MSVGRKYDGPIRVGMVFTAPDNDGELGFRRVKVIGRDADDGCLIVKELPSRLRGARAGVISKFPEFNLRVVFFLEDERPIANPNPEPSARVTVHDCP